jgi:hypothetical protein
MSDRIADRVVPSDCFNQGFVKQDDDSVTAEEARLDAKVNNCMPLRFIADLSAFMRLKTSRMQQVSACVLADRRLASVNDLLSIATIRNGYSSTSSWR